MADPLPEFHLGIIGGCMSHQRGTPLNTLYHRQLAAMLERDPGVRMRVHVARDFGLDYATRLNRLLEARPIDGLLVHVREATITAAAKAFVQVPIDGRSHPVHRHPGAPVLGQEPRLAELAPGDDVSAGGVEPDHRRIVPARPRVTIDPSFSSSGVEAEDAVDLRHAVHGRRQEIHGV